MSESYSQFLPRYLAGRCKTTSPYSRNELPQAGAITIIVSSIESPRVLDNEPDIRSVFCYRAQATLR